MGRAAEAVARALQEIASSADFPVNMHRTFDARKHPRDRRGRFRELPAGVVTRALERAGEAHHSYEKGLGKPDEDWAGWYAGEFMRSGFRVVDPSGKPLDRKALGGVLKAAADEQARVGNKDPWAAFYAREMGKRGYRTVRR